MENYNVCTFVFHFVTVLALEAFLNSSFVISPQKDAPTSHFHTSQHGESGRENSYLIRVYSLKNHMLISRNGLVSNV